MVRADTSAASQPHAVEPKPTEGVIVCPFVVIIDSREQSPFTFQGLTIRNRELIVPRKVKGLATGDYSIEGMESRITIERKSADDLLGSIGGGHDRFRREHERMRAMVEAGGFSAVVCEGGLDDVLGRLQHPGIIQKQIDDCHDAMQEIEKVKSQITAEIIDESNAGTLRLEKLIERELVSQSGVDTARRLADLQQQFRLIDGRKLHPSSLLGIIASWPIRYGVQYDFAGSRRLAEQLTFWRLWHFWHQVKEDQEADNQ